MFNYFLFIYLSMSSLNFKPGWSDLTTPRFERGGMRLVQQPTWPMWGESLTLVLNIKDPVSRLGRLAAERTSPQGNAR